MGRIWNKKIPGHCNSIVATWYASAIFALTTDVILLVLPIPLVRSIQRPFKEKALLYVVFGIGILYAHLPSAPHSDADTR